jgi:hypothetical protein
VIRRDAYDDAGRSHWLLINQTEHARLAWQLADRWQFDVTLPSDVRAPLLAAILHHDDGWQDWDRHPGLDGHGQPLNFTEMPTPISTDIWRRSVAAAMAIGPLATYAIAGHFRALLLRFDSWRRGEEAGRRAAEDFIEFADTEMKTALERWCSSGAGHAAQWAETSLHMLQTFDALSLWLCCAARTAPERFTIPGGKNTTFSPRDVHSICVSPWPFASPDMPLEVQATMFPIGRGAGQAFQSADCAAERLRWRLLPGEIV